MKLEVTIKGLFVLVAAMLPWAIARAQPLVTPGEQTPTKTAPTDPKAAPKVNVNRPPLEGSSHDIGRYEVKLVNGKVEVSLLNAATEIEAKLGESFGFTWSLRGFTGTRLVPIRTIVKHPSFTPKGEKAPRTMFEEKIFFKPINGSTNWPFLYKFDSEEELAVGDWVMQVFYDQQLIAEHTFKVVPAKK